MPGSFSKLCGGNVRPSRFVVLGTANTVTEAGANGDVWGISQPYTWKMALSGWDDGFAGTTASPPINIFGPGDDACKLVLGGTVSIGQKIKSDANGAGVAVTADQDKVGAVAQEAGISGDVIWVKPMRFDRSG